MPAPVEELKAIPILDVAKSLGLNFRGTRMRCFNPMHEDRKTPSLHFNARGNYFNCFGCEIGGSTIDLVISFSGCSKKDAMHWLAQEFGLSSRTCSARRFHLPVHKQRLPTEGQQPRPPRRRPDPEVYDWLLENAPLPHEASEYLLQRGLSARTISDFRLGGSLDARSLVRAAEKRFGSDRVFHAGLLTESKHSKTLWPVWWEPIVLIPFYWKERAPVYLQTRQLTTDDRRKYVGLCGVSKPLFNAKIIHELTAGAAIYIVEGAMDAMAAHEVGLPAIGVLGAKTRFKGNWVQALRDFQVIIIPDQDDPGLQFKNRVVAAFANVGKSVQVRYLPAEYDDLTDALAAIQEGKL